MRAGWVGSKTWGGAVLILIPYGIILYQLYQHYVSRRPLDSIARR